MDVKDFLDEQYSMIEDVKDTTFEYSNITVVPLVSDSGLTYESGDTKKGKILESCVLFTDIRNSVDLNKNHHTDTMGKIYTAFTKGVLNTAAYYGGMVRNIIGDRVMVVFPSKDCYKNAVYCATAIGNIADFIDNDFKNVDFKCGIGIDYGEMHVIKVGVEKHSGENEENRNLIWIGKPANLASRLCDVAGKTFKEKAFVVKGKFYHFNYWGNASLIDPRASGWYEETRKLSAEEMMKDMTYEGGRMFKSGITDQSDFKLVEEEIQYKRVLISDRVYQGYKKACPDNQDVKEGWWKEPSREVKDVDCKVWEADVVWKCKK